MGFLTNKRRRKDEGVEPEVPATTDAPKAPARKRRGPDIVTIIILAVILVGAGIIAYPTFSDWWNSYHQTRAIASYVSAVENAEPQKIAEMLDEAHRYNEELLHKANRYAMSDDEQAEYQRVLDLTGTGIMGYVQIAKIGINYPIYHGTEERVIQMAIGHIEGSSLPVGGTTTHAAISGHRGLPRAKLFSDLDKLVEGDTFTITVLNETLTYEIDQIRIVLPEDMSELNFVQGMDYVTLITCTPYGINSHRMLVRGHRVTNLAGTLSVPAEAVQIPNYVAVPAVAVPMLFIYLVGSLLYYHFKKDGYDKELVMEALDELKEEAEKVDEIDEQ